MRKVWNTLVVLGVLLCMVMSLGVTADAAPAQDDAAIFAVSGTQLQPENIGVMGTQNPSCLVVDVDGLDEGQSATGYNVVYVGSDPGIMTDYAYIWPGFAQQFTVGTQSRKVVLVGVGEASTADEINAAIGGYLADDLTVIAVGPAAAAAAVSGCADVDLFMTTGLDDAAAAGTIPVANVGKEAETPVSMVRWNEDGTVAASAIPVPQPVADPGVGIVEQSGDAEPAPDGTEPVPDGTEPAPDGTESDMGTLDEPMVGGPVIDAPEVDVPETVIYYAVQYDGNGRDEGTYVPDDMQVAGGSDYVLRDNGYTRAGYSFVGWTLDVPDAETVYQPGDHIIVNANTTVYAKWAAVEVPVESEPVVEGTEGNGEPVVSETEGTGEPVVSETEGTGEPVVSETEGTGEPVVSETEGTGEPVVSETEGTGEPVVNETEGTGEPVVDETEGTGEPEEPTEESQFQVTYKAGEGTGDDQGFRYDSGTEITLPDGSAFTAPEGKKFSGWLQDGAETVYGVAETYTVTDNVTFVAQYQERVVYTVTYDLGDSGNESYSVPVYDGDSHALAEAPAVIPENREFNGWLVDGEAKAVGDVIVVTGDMTVTADWAITAVNVTYRSGVEGVADAEPVSVDVGSSLNLPDNPFAFPEDLTFTGWRQVTTVDGVDTIDTEGEPLQPNDVVDVGETDLVFVAQTVKMTSATVTYLPGDGSDMKAEEQTGSFEVGSNVQHTLAALPADFTVPEGKTFGGWKIGDSTYQPGDSVTVSENTTVTAIWNDVEKEKVDPAVDTDSLLYTKGGADRLEMSFKAKIDTVSVDNAALTLNTQYGVAEDGDTSTVFFDNNYLNGLAEGDHTVNVTFVATDTTEYTPNTRTLTIKAEPVPTAAPTETPAPANDVKDVRQTWDRTQNLTIDFAQYGRGNPTKLELLRAYEKDESGNYKRDESGNYIPVWSELTSGKDYTINGTSMTVYPSLLGSWPSQQYGFRVTFDGAGTDKGVNTLLLYLDVKGDVAKQDTAPTATGSSGYVTGESVNLRAGAGTDSQVLRTVAKGTKITIYSISNGWAYVSVDGVTGYMSADYVAYDNATPTATPAGATSPATGDTNNVVLYIVLLVVLLIALAAVLIVVIKRRKK